MGVESLLPCACQRKSGKESLGSISGLQVFVFWETAGIKGGVSLLRATTAALPTAGDCAAIKHEDQPVHRARCREPSAAM